MTIRGNKRELEVLQGDLRCDLVRVNEGIRDGCAVGGGPERAVRTASPQPWRPYVSNVYLPGATQSDIRSYSHSYQRYMILMARREVDLHDSVDESCLHRLAPPDARLGIEIDRRARGDGAHAQLGVPDTVPLPPNGMMAP